MLMRTKTWRIVDQKSEYISDQSRKSSGIDMRDCEAGWQGMARSVRAQAKAERGRQGRVEGGGKGAGGLEGLSEGGVDNRAEDKHRRRFFSHHDIGSVCASLSVTAQLRTLQRRNTTTGASAASAALRNSGGGESPESEESGDPGDGVSNEQVLR